MLIFVATYFEICMFMFGAVYFAICMSAPVTVYFEIFMLIFTDIMLIIAVMYVIRLVC